MTLKKRAEDLNTLDFKDRLMQSFGESFKGDFTENVFKIMDKEYFTFSAVEFLENNDFVCGFGASFDRSSAVTKAIAEFYERKAARYFYDEVNKFSVISNDKAYSFKQFQTSNGWAVFETLEEAKHRAYLEALERHILLCSFIKLSWSGFTLIDNRQIDGIQFYSLVSKFSCNGFSAGIVIAKSDKLKGVTFGYLCESSDKIRTSAKWEHAMFEALGQIETHLELKNIESLKPNGPLEDMIYWYMLNDWIAPEFSKDDDRLELTRVNPEYKIFDLSQNPALNAPLFAAFCTGGGLVPLFFPNNLNEAAKTFLSEILLKNTITVAIPERHPVL